MTNRRLPLAGLLAVSSLLTTGPSRADEPSSFKDNVKPILERRCVRCHNGTRSRGGLNLSTRKGLMAGGNQGPAVVPGKSAESLLIELVSGDKPAMPRKGDPLTPQQVAALRQWIDTGADFPDGVKLIAKAPKEEADWWAVKPVKRPPLPPVKNTQWVRTPIDAFILAKLEAKGLRPSPEAKRAALIRRLTFNLHGLPPTPEAVRAFVDDQSPRAYENLVDRLLASPRYGERWGRHWLDVVHYGDTHGYDKDKRRDHAWPYRDYVIKSFNDDKPYARFIKEQIAGDVLFPGDPDGIIATGFVAAGPWDFVGHVELREGTVAKKKTRLLDRDDMLANTMSTFVSLTVHCARCHDHKFDPIAQKDYYRLQAVFAGVERGDRPYEDRDATARRKALTQRRTELLARREDVRKTIAALSSPALTRLDGALKKLRRRLAKLPRPAGTRPSPTNGYHSGIEPKPQVRKWVQVDLGRPLPIDVIRLVPARPTDFPDTPGFGFPARFRVDLSNDPAFGKYQTVADHTKTDFPNPGDNPLSLRAAAKKARYVRVTAEKLWPRRNDYCFALAELQVESGGKNVALGKPVTALDSINAGRWNTKNLVDNFDSRRDLPDRANPTVAAALKERSELATRIAQAEKSRRDVVEKLIAPRTRRERDRVAAALTEVARGLKALAKPARVYAVLPRAPRPIHLLARGNVEAPKEAVAPGAPGCVPGLPAEFDLADPGNEGARRAALAKWIARSDNPLTWRSIGNRVWHYHFGRGLVDTPNDFGANGSTPTHPRLLDWLAAELRDNGGSLKKLHRRILTSSVYRQSSRHDPAMAKLDADNRYLWRMRRARLDAESIRDAVLAVSGKLDLTMGGPGFELFAFKDDHSPHYDHTALAKIHDPATYRRAVYRFVVRSVPNPFLESLDCADPNINVPVRNTTLTALQALALLNNPFMVRQAEYFAQRLKKVSDDPEERLAAGVELAFGRPATPQERKALAAYANKHSLANACRLLFNANEFVFVD